METQLPTEPLLRHPNVYAFSDLRAYLGAWKSILDEEESSQGSFTALSRRLGVPSRTKMRRMFKGSIAMPKAILDRMAEVSGLSADESAYLGLLRKFTQSDDPERAISIYETLLAYRRKHLKEAAGWSLSEKQLRLFEKWYYMPILYFLDLRNDGIDVPTIVRAFKGKISAEETEGALQVLTEIELITRGPDGKLQKSHGTTTLLDHVPRPLMKKFHQMMIERAQESIYGMPEDRRFLMSASIPMMTAAVPVIRKRIEDFIVGLNEEFSVANAETLYQVNIQLFNLAAAPAPIDEETLDSE